MKRSVAAIFLCLLLSNLYIHAQQVGNPAPDFEVNLEGGGTFKLSDQQGKVVFIFLFGNTCPSCIAIGPTIESDINQFFTVDPNFVAIGLDTWNGSSASVTAFRNSTGISFPLGLMASSVASGYSTTYDRLLVVDSEGILVHKGITLAGSDINNAKQAVQTALDAIETDPCEEANINITSMVSDPSCHGERDGSVDITVTGNYPPFVYDWSNGSTIEDLSGLEAGTYDLLVTDNEGCTATHQVVLNEPDPIAIDETIRNPACHDGTDGMIRIEITGGTAPYQIKWPDNSSLDSLSGIGAGCYLVEVTDANGCVEEKEICLVSPDPILINESVRHPDCNGAEDGIILIEITGGTAPYQIKWPDNSSLDSLSGIGAGCYLVEVTDADGCIAEKEICLVDPEPLVIMETVYSPGCNGDSTGAIKIQITGGTAPYQIRWFNESSMDSISGLALGCYQVEVWDAKGCSTTREICVDAIVISGIITNPVCHMDSSGSIQIEITGGVEPYTVSWSNGSVQDSLGGLGAGCYTVTVTDAENCMGEKEFCLVAPEQAALGDITGESNPAEQSIHSYSVSQEEGYQYTWEAVGGSIIDGQGSHQVEVQWGNAGEASLSVTAVSNEGCASDTVSLSFSVTGTTGSFTEESPNARIYPNPVKDILSVDSEVPFRLYLYDISGAQLLISTENRINLDFLGKGTYIVKLATGDKVYRKIMIKH